ncbi:hypothetical protein PTKIN_Ptkin05aG0037300 [Pterospermum kingtungense]
MIKAAPILLKGVQLLVGNGQSTAFWLDHWLFNEPMVNFLVRDIDIVDKHRMVCEYWLENEGWNWNLLDGLLPNAVLDKLAAVVLRDDVDCVDGYCWNKSKSGLFTIKSAYQVTTGEVLIGDNTVWKKLWKLNVPNRVRSFCWLLNHKKVMCNAERVKRGFTTNGACSF